MLELEVIVQECIMTTIRESIPTEDIIRAYMDESIEHEEEVTIEHINEPTIVDTQVVLPKPDVETQPSLGIVDKDDEEVTTRLKFSDYDSVVDEMNTVESVNAPKTIERLEEISVSHALQRKIDDAQDDTDEIIEDTISYDKTSEDVDIALFDIEEMN